MIKSKTSTWFETKIRVERTQEDGLQKSVTESYTVEAINWTDAEAAITGEMTAYGNSDFEITDIKKAAYKEIYFSDNPKTDKWYKCKVRFISLDERTGKEKRSNVICLVQAENIDKAKANIDAAMHGTMIDYEVISVVETKLLEVYEYNTPKGESKPMTDNGKTKPTSAMLKAMKNLEDSVPQGCKMSISTDTGKTIVEFDKTEAKGGNARDD